MITSLWVQHALSWNQLVPLADGAIWPPIMNEGMTEGTNEMPMTTIHPPARAIAYTALHKMATAVILSGEFQSGTR